MLTCKYCWVYYIDTGISSDWDKDLKFQQQLELLEIPWKINSMENKFHF